eukprot:sb/3473890/
MVHMINGGDEITLDEVDPLYSLTVGSPPLYSTQNSTHQVCHRGKQGVSSRLIKGGRDNLVTRSLSGLGNIPNYQQFQFFKIPFSQSIASSSSSGQLRDAPTPSTSTAGADGVGEITADQQGGSPDVSGDPGYSSDTERYLVGETV